jgi:di/tricarboxylate transporter
VTNTFSLALVPYWTAFVYHIFLGNELSMLATSVPPLMNFAKAPGIHLLPLGLLWSFAAGGKIFVYQSGVLVTGYSYGYFEAKDLLRVGFALTVVESLVLLLIVPFYWPLIGIR